MILNKGKIMIKIIILVLSIMVAALWAISGSSKNAYPNSTSSTSFYDLKVKSLNNEDVDLKIFRGKKLLIVNVASRCGYTPQYKGLQELYEAHGDKIEILGFPCNDFGEQEPGTAKEIASFCSLNYGVTFSMMEKVHVKGNNIHPVYDWLTDKDLNGWNSTKPSWNFCKYLISEEGELLKFYRSGVKPMSSELTTDIIQPPLLKK